MLRRIFLPLPEDRLVERFVRCIVGLAMFITSELCAAPWDVCHVGVERHTGIDVGRVIEITGVFILLLWIPLRERMGWGTLLNAVEIGLVVFALGDSLPHADRLVLRAAYLAGGLLAIGFGFGLYISAGLCSGPRDGLMLGLAKRGHSVRLARTGIEAAVLVVGILLGGNVGVGTAVFAFGIGPVVQYFLPRLRLHNDRTVLATAH